MVACAMQTFNNVTADVWNCLKTTLAEHGITVNSDAGSANAHGIYASWKYTSANEILQIQISKITNIFVGCSAANGYLQKAVQKCYSSHNLEASQMLELD